MTDQLLSTHKTGALWQIRLDRPKALNALNLDLLKQLDAALAAGFADPEVKTIWLDSQAARAFCAGGDVKALALALIDEPTDDAKRQLATEYFELEYTIDLLIEQSPKPIVVFAEGITFGGGWGLFAGANLKLCSDSATFAMPEIQIGLYPDVGAAHFLQQGDWRLGTFLAISGITLSAAEALALGFVDGLITHDYAQSLQRQLSAGLAPSELDILSVDPRIEPLYQQWHSALQLLPKTGTLSDWLVIAEQNSQLEPFARAIDSWATGSAWSIALTWQHFSRQRGKTRAEVLVQELVTGANACAYPEFVLGVQAKLIDKLPRADWAYDRVESVPIDELNAVLATPPIA